jgi:signal transduction histidine kinase
LTALSVTKPLDQLKIGAARLSGGDYSARVRLNGKNEIGELSNSFDLMADQIQEEISLREKSESIRKQVTLDIAHDLKNPLAVISGYAEYCLKNPDQNNETYLNIINQKCSQVNGLINRLFELSKLESPEYKLNRKNCDFAEYIRMKCAELIQNLEAAGFEYDFEVPEQEIFLEADLKEMDRVLDNIFENALRYNKKGTKITLELKKLEDCVQIVIADNGIGIPQNYTESIFQPFTRTDEARSSETGGSGLGLAIVDKIVRLHQGNITLESDVGKGCAFKIRIPLY